MAKPNIGDLIPVGAIGTAKAPQVLTGYTFSGDAGVGLAGSMPNRGTLNRTLSTQGQSVSIASGYYTGGKITSNFSNLYASNIKSDVVIGGVRGNYKGESLTGQEIILKQDDFIQFDTDQTKYVYTIPAIYKNYHTIKIYAEGYSSWRSNTYVAGTLVGNAFSADNTDRPDIIYSYSSGSVSLKNTRGRNSYLEYKISYYL